MTYRVWVLIGADWFPISRDFAEENFAQEWALDLIWPCDVRAEE